MFTGLIETQGIITRTEHVAGGMRLEVYAPEFGRDMALGDSVAVDGACLTIVKFIRGAFLSDVTDETLQRTTLGELRQGGHVNLERAMRLSDRLGGHIVSGHVDAVGKLAMRQPGGNGSLYRFGAPPDLVGFLVEKGSVAVDGISLTVASLHKDGFTAAVIPHTEQVTTLGEKAIGAKVNLESDLFAKYVKKYVAAYLGSGDEPERGSTKRSLGDLLKDLTEGR